MLAVVNCASTVDSFVDLAKDLFHQARLNKFINKSVTTLILLTQHKNHDCSPIQLFPPAPLLCKSDVLGQQLHVCLTEQEVHEHWVTLDQHRFSCVLESQLCQRYLPLQHG